MRKSDVLIVDDDKNICELMTEYCKNLELFRNIVIANDGAIASVKLQNQNFGLIILDMNLPKKNGLQLLNEFNKDKNSNRVENVLVVSGTLDRDLISKVTESGVKNFLIKPFDESLFKEKVTKMLS